MEEGAVAVTTFLTRLIMPVGAGAVILGLLTIVKGLGGFRGPRDPELGVVAADSTVSGRAGSSVLERVAAGLCGTLAVVLIVLLGVNTTRSGMGGSLWPAVLLVMFLLLAAPAILWNTRFRVAGEGIATVAIAGIAIVTGFSIGFLFVPVVLLMICLCIQQLRRFKSRAESDRPRVDSLP